MRVPFWKVESVGNDFVLVERHALEALGIGEDRLPEIARRVSPRRFSIGSDGLLALDTRAQPLAMRMFNPDGSEDFCGNGMRCAAQFASERGVAAGQFELNHGGRTVPIEVTADGTIRTMLERASFDPRDVPLAEGVGELFDRALEVDGQRLTVSSLSTGSTHTLLFVDALPLDEPFERLGRALEHHPAFPERTSAIWVVVEDEHTLRIRIWERGAGETQGCGTGSSAAAIAHLRRRGGGGAIAVHNPGGTLVVSTKSWDSPITVEGEARVLFSGTFLL